MSRKLVLWEVGGYIFIGIVGAALHFTYEFSNFSSNLVAYFSAVNESTWEHLKMVFFPGLVFALIEYTYVRDLVRNYILAKTVSLFLMPLVITVGWYIYAPAVGRSIFPVDLALFYVAVLVGQIASYKILTMPPLPRHYFLNAWIVLIFMFISFSTFTFFPPRIFIFEHFDLKNTGEYGILDNYDNLRYFTKAPEKP